MKTRTEIERLISKAAKAPKSDDALRFALAANSAASALCALQSVKAKS